MKLAPGQTVIYSGDVTLHEGGVVIVFSQQAEKSLVEWTPVKKRTTTARLHTYYQN